ncbi:hypothetical protein Tco_0598281 [Tanacetum coccineum]
MLLAMKDEAGGTLNDEESDFMLDNAYGDETLEELTFAVIMMAHIQPTDNIAETEPKYDAEAVSEVNVSHIDLISGMISKSVHEHIKHEKLKTVINTFDDDQIDSNIISDDPHRKIMVEQMNMIQMLMINLLILNPCENEKVIIQHETQLAKKAFKERENRYLEDNDDLEDKLIGLGYKNPERLKKAIATQPKMYDGERLHNTKLIIDSPDSEETLEDAKESRLKMKNKMIKLNYEKLNALYDTFIPQKEFSIEQTYFSTPSTSNVTSESSKEISDLPTQKIPNERQKNEILMLEKEKISSDSKDIQANLLKRIKFLKMTLNDLKLKVQHQREVNDLIENVNQKTYAYGDVRSQNQDLLMIIFELKDKIKTIENGKNVNTKFDKSETLGKLLYVTQLNTNIAVKAKRVSNTEVKADRSKPVTSHSTPKNEKSVESFNIVKRPESKDTKLKKRVLKNTNVKITSANVLKFSSSVSIVSNKCESMNSTFCQSNANVLKSKTVNAVNDDSRVKRALFTSPVAAKSRNLGATSVVAKSRFSVAKTPTATNKIFYFDTPGILSSHKYDGSDMDNHSFDYSDRQYKTMLLNKENVSLVIGCARHNALSFLKTLGFLWAKLLLMLALLKNRSLVRSLVHTRYNKTPYELIKGRKPNVQYFYVFGSLCYIINNCDDLGKLKPRADIVPLKEDLDNLFGPLYEEYYVTSTPKVSDDSAVNTLPNEDNPSSSSIVVEEDKAP